MNSILVEKFDSVIMLRLNRPEKFNSFNREMALLLQEELSKADNDSSIRCVLITGEGKAFCAGQDLAEAISPEGPGIEKIVDEHYNPIIRSIRGIRKPVICAVNGVAAGAGANIALACDIVIASRTASFIQAFSKIGLIPDSGGTFFLPRLVGFQKASALMMLGDKVNASEAMDMGMIYKIYDEDQLIIEAKNLSKLLSTMPTAAIAHTKNLLNHSLNNNLNAQLDLERDIQVVSASTYDYQEGVNAFLEKRKPNFKGE